MTTVAAIIDRLFRTYLEPPDYQPAFALLASDVNDITTSIPLTNFAIPEDEQLVRLNILVEMGRELMIVTAYNSATKTLTVTRGQEGTAAEDHLANSKLKLKVPYSRQSVFEAVADNITSLHPLLFTVKTEQLSSDSGNIAGLDDNLAVDVIEIWPDNWGATDESFDGRIVDYHPSVGGRAVVSNIWTGSMWVKYRRRMGSVAAETDTLDALGVDARWVNIIMAGAAADLLVGRDIPASVTDWVGQVLEAENIRVGTRQSIGFGLAQYRDLLLKRANKEMQTEYKPKVHVRDPFGQRTRSGIG
jgi:hypothetical protein